MKVSYAHNAYFAKELECSVAFYEKLGITKWFEFKTEAGEVKTVYMKIGEGQFIELFNHAPHNTQTGGSYAHLCLWVEDMESALKDLAEAGIKPDAQPKRGLDKNLQCWLTDPDGNRIELMELHPDAPQNTREDVLVK